MGIIPGKFIVEGLQTIDLRRIQRAGKETREQNKKRIRRRVMNKSKEEAEEYLPGGF